uniref:Putative ovule protein n=1 Tax=Solanum chacoense TaxID=4108 RepID=A0A0V0ITJ4_SOLCH
MKEKEAMVFLGFLGKAVLMMTVISISIFALLYLLKLNPSQIDLQVCFHFTLLYISIKNIVVICMPN